MPALLALIAVTAVWGVTFVQVKDALELYPLFAFLAVRFAIASRRRSPPRPPAGCGRSGGRAGSPARRSGSCSRSATRCRRPGSSGRPSRAPASSPGCTSSSRRCSRSLLFRTRVGGAVWVGVALAVVGLAMLSGVGAGDPLGDLLVLLGSAAYSRPDRADGAVRAALRPDRVHAGGDARGLRRLRGRRASRSGRSRCRTAGPSGARSSSPGSSRARSPSSSRRGRSGARARRAPRSPSRWSPSGPGFFGFWLAGDRLGAIGWGGCALIMAGIVVAEPEAGRTLRRLVGRTLNRSKLQHDLPKTMAYASSCDASRSRSSPDSPWGLAHEVPSSSEQVGAGRSGVVCRRRSSIEEGTHMRLLQEPDAPSAARRWARCSR